MTAYYNEIDRFNCDWLSNIMDAGLITPGKIDDRSIVDVRPDELAGFERVHFFAGIGGWDLSYNLARWRAPIWTGSCPCQPFSLAGKQKGFADDRHLWPHFRELIRLGRPATVFGEQVASASDWLRLVRSDLEALGYAVGAVPIEAASAGADHLRDRFWFVADRQGKRGREVFRHVEGAAGGGSGAGHAASSGEAIELADAHDAGSQGWRLLPERTGERAAGPDGVADADEPGAREGRQQRGREFGGTGGDPKACALGDGASLAERKPDHEGDAVTIGGQARPISGGASDHLEWVIGADGKARRVKPGIRLLAHGVPNRVGLLRGFGNAIDPRPAAAFIEAAMSALHSPHEQRQGS